MRHNSCWRAFFKIILSINFKNTQFSVVCHLAATMLGVVSLLRQAKNKAVLCVMREHYF